MCASLIAERPSAGEPWVVQAGSVQDDFGCYLSVLWPLDPTDPDGVPVPNCDRRDCKTDCIPKSTVLLNDDQQRPLQIKLECCCGD